MSKSPAPEYRNYYKCPSCHAKWHYDRHSLMDDECPNCGMNTPPYKCELVSPATPDTEGEKILKKIAAKATGNGIMTDNQEALYNEIVDHALKHGEDDDPDHEVGDLQQALRAALDIMTETQRKALEQHLTEQDFFQEAL